MDKTILRNQIQKALHDLDQVKALFYRRQAISTDEETVDLKDRIRRLEARVNFLTGRYTATCWALQDQFGERVHDQFKERNFQISNLTQIKEVRGKYMNMAGNVQTYSNGERYIDLLYIPEEDTIYYRLGNHIFKHHDR